MAKYVSKPVDAYSFKECISIGKNIKDAHILGGIVLSFTWNKIVFTHEKDDHYIVSSNGITYDFTPDHMLIFYDFGVFEIMPKQTFNYNYKKEDAILGPGECSK